MKEANSQSSARNSDGRDSFEIARLLIDGQTSAAIRKLRAGLATHPEDPIHKSELACALALSGETFESESLLSTMKDAAPGTIVGSRIEATRAILYSAKGELGSI